ncbi:MAG: monooxygenase, partial [Alphaproteobacteria bacterium]|nr:monooxygenase [Alphaproteobacteria bacterium]
NRKGNFVAHRYRYSPRISMFIVECDAPTYAEAGFQTMSERECQAYCQQLFSADLGGKALISNHSTWCQFPVARVENWIDGNRVLIGDALRSVHFSVVSGTRLVRRDAIALWRKFTAFPNDIPEGLKMFETSRGPIVEKLLAAAEGSYAWYKDIAKHMRLEPLDLAYDYMTRSGRVDDVRLRRIAPRFMADYDQSKRGYPLADPPD